MNKDAGNRGVMNLGAGGRNELKKYAGNINEIPSKLLTSTMTPNFDRWSQRI
jgi:hypothetical protein